MRIHGSGNLGHRLAGTLLAVFLLATGPTCVADAPLDKLVIYPVTEGMPRSGDFTIKIRNPGQEWRDLAAYFVKVVQVVDTKGTPQDTSLASFDFSGAVEVSVTYNKEAINSARIRPLSYGIKPEVHGNTITFSLTQPRNVSVEVNGDIFHNLQLFANPLEANRPDPADPNISYYGPGIHPVNTVRVPTGKTVYIAGGTLVKGQFLVNNV